MTHPWKSTDEKRTIVFSYSPGNNIIKYLTDMRDLINRAIINAYAIAKSDNNQIPSPIILSSITGLFKVPTLNVMHTLLSANFTYTMKLSGIGIYVIPYTNISYNFMGKPFAY